MPIIYSFDKTKIYYYLYKPRRSKGALLFIHGGFFGNHSLLQKIYSNFKDYTIIAPDTRGQGDSDFPNNLSEQKLEYYANDIYSILRKEKIKEVTLVGVSFGGIIALKYCEIFMQKIKINRFVLISSSYTTKHFGVSYNYLIPVIKIILRILDLVWFFPEARKKKIDYSKVSVDFFTLGYGLTIVKNNSVKTIIWRYILAINVLYCEVAPSALKKFNFPVLIIYGKKDGFFSYKIQKEMAKYIKKARIVIINNDGHNIYFSKAKKIAQLIRGFLFS